MPRVYELHCSGCPYEGTKHLVGTEWEKLRYEPLHLRVRQIC